MVSQVDSDIICYSSNEKSDHDFLFDVNMEEDRHEKWVDWYTTSAGSYICSHRINNLLLMPRLSVEYVFRSPLNIEKSQPFQGSTSLDFININKPGLYTAVVRLYMVVDRLCQGVDRVLQWIEWYWALYDFISNSVVTSPPWISFCTPP